jgi:hypothetical protein
MHRVKFLLRDSDLSRWRCGMPITYASLMMPDMLIAYTNEKGGAPAPPFSYFLAAVSN